MKYCTIVDLERQNECHQTTPLRAYCMHFLNDILVSLLNEIEYR